MSDDTRCHLDALLVGHPLKVFRPEYPPRRVAGIAGDDMDVVVGNGLAGGHAVVLKDIEASGIESLGDGPRDPVDMPRHRCGFVRAEVYHRGGMAFGDHEHMPQPELPWIQKSEGIGQVLYHGALVLARYVLAEWATVVGGNLNRHGDYAAPGIAAHEYGIGLDRPSYTKTGEYRSNGEVTTTISWPLREWTSAHTDQRLLNSGESRGAEPPFDRLTAGFDRGSGDVPPNKNGNPKDFLEPP